MKKRKRSRGCFPGILVTILFGLATGYIVYIAATQPERMTLLLTQSEPAPAIARAADEPEGNYNLEIELPGMESHFSFFNYYIADRRGEYEAYKAVNPALTDEEVVWHVNADLHRIPFIDAELIRHSNPLLVNPYNRLPEYFMPAALEIIDEYGRLATPETISAFNRIQTAALDEEIYLYVQSAYRTIAHQRELYEQAGENGMVARPMFSEHHTGRALDLGGVDGLLDVNGPTKTGRWVAEHAHEYGFIIRYTEANRHITGYPDEPWHITYVGEAIARAMKNNGYGSLEEYVAKNPGAALP
jgi:hypothetical protein